MECQTSRLQDTVAELQERLEAAEKNVAALEQSYYQSPCLPDLLAALGWEGGTIHQALQEVRRLRAARPLGDIK